jgi:hypothetical protein
LQANKDIRQRLPQTSKLLRKAIQASVCIAIAVRSEARLGALYIAEEDISRNIREASRT